MVLRPDGIKFGNQHSRQSVSDRPQKFQDELEDIHEDNLAVAEQGLHTLMKSTNEHILACPGNLPSRPGKETRLQ